MKNSTVPIVLLLIAMIAFWGAYRRGEDHEAHLADLQEKRQEKLEKLEKEDLALLTQRQEEMQVAMARRLLEGGTWPSPTKGEKGLRTSLTSLTSLTSGNLERAYLWVCNRVPKGMCWRAGAVMPVKEVSGEVVNITFGAMGTRQGCEEYLRAARYFQAGHCFSSPERPKLPWNHWPTQRVVGGLCQSHGLVLIFTGPISEMESAVCNKTDYRWLWEPNDDENAWNAVQILDGYWADHPKR